MIKREEVEALLLELRDANQWRQHQGKWGPSAAFVQDHATRIEELARTWLRVNDAPVGVVLQVAGAYQHESVLLRCDARGVRNGNVVRLLPEADSGGEG